MCAAHAAGGGGDGAAARALPTVARRHQEAHRGADRARVPGAHARRPQGLHLRGIGAPDPLTRSPRSPTRAHFASPDVSPFTASLRNLSSTDVNG